MNLYLVAAEITEDYEREFAAAATDETEAMRLVNQETGQQDATVRNVCVNVLSCGPRILFECGK